VTEAGVGVECILIENDSRSFSVSRSNRHRPINIVSGIESIALIRMIPGAELRL
jgi:hypothetical protein